MALEKKIEKMSMRQAYQNHWHVELMDSPGEDPGFFCAACLCGPCASYMLRKRALYDDMSKYECCGGYMPCSGRCCESSCPEMCLCAEVLCCFNNSVASTRFLLQDEFNIQTSKCDNCIIGTMVCMSQLACICSLVAMITGADEIEEAAQLLGCVSDIITCVVCPCMQTQAKLEMDKRDGKSGQPSVMEVPPVQQMSRLDQPIPPEAGYPAPPVYDQAPAPTGYPPPSQGYPAPSQGQVYLPPQGHVYSPPQGYSPPHGQVYPPPQGQVYPPTQGQVYPPPQGQVYPPPQGQVYPPPQAQGYPSPQGQGYPSPQGHGYPSPQGHGYPPPQGQGYPPPQGQGYPPANYPPPSY